MSSRPLLPPPGIVRPLGPHAVLCSCPCLPCRSPRGGAAPRAKPSGLLWGRLPLVPEELRTQREPRHARTHGTARPHTRLPLTGTRQLRPLDQSARRAGHYRDSGDTLVPGAGATWWLQQRAAAPPRLERTERRPRHSPPGPLCRMGTGRAPRHPRLLLRPPSEQRAVPRSTGAPALGPAMASPPGTASASGPLKFQPACCGLGQHLGTCVLGSEQRPRCSSPEGPHGLGTDEVRAAVFQPHAVHPCLGARGLAHSDRERTVVHGKAQRECLKPWKKRPRRLIGPSLPCPSGWDTPDLGETTPVTAQRGCAPAERRRVS